MYRRLMLTQARAFRRELTILRRLEVAFVKLLQKMIEFVRSPLLWAVAQDLQILNAHSKTAFSMLELPSNTQSHFVQVFPHPE